MPNVVRQGDINAVGGVCQLGAGTVTCEGLPVGFPGRPVTPHPPCGAPGQQAHCTAKTTGGSGTVTCEGKPVLLVTDIDTCGHARQTSAATVTAGK